MAQTAEVDAAQLVQGFCAQASLWAETFGPGSLCVIFPWLQQADAEDLPVGIKACPNAQAGGHGMSAPARELSR